MVLIKVTCQNCHEDVEMASYCISLTVFDHGHGHYYKFCCPLCNTVSKNYCDDMIADLLVGQGRVVTTVVHVAEEFLEEKSGPPITHADLDSFLAYLDTL